MQAIIAIDERGGIGTQGRLCVSCPEDLRFFKKSTLGGVVICGAKTLATFPKGLPLAGRQTWVLSRTLNPMSDSDRPCKVFHNLDALLKALEGISTPVWVAGGQSVYEQLLPLCSSAVVTIFHKLCLQADAFFPDLRHEQEWVLTRQVGPMTYDKLTYSRLWFERTF